LPSPVEARGSKTSRRSLSIERCLPAAR